MAVAVKNAVENMVIVFGNGGEPVFAHVYVGCELEILAIAYVF